MAARKAYQDLSDEFVARVQQQTFIGAFDLCKIAAWKSAQSVALITVNEPQVIEEVTASTKAALAQWLDPPTNVIEEEPDWDQLTHDIQQAVGSSKRGTGLLGLHGVAYPLASAILRVWNPHVFPVIDKHAVRAVRAAFPGALPKGGSAMNTGAGYVLYIKALARSGQTFGGHSSIHQRDIEAMTAGRPLSKA